MFSLAPALGVGIAFILGSLQSDDSEFDDFPLQVLQGKTGPPGPWPNNLSKYIAQLNTFHSTLMDSKYIKKLNTFQSTLKNVIPDFRKTESLE